jgi:hypothetical protein
MSSLNLYPEACCRNAGGGGAPHHRHPFPQLIYGHFIQRRRNRILLIGLSFLPLGYILPQGSSQMIAAIYNSLTSILQTVLRTRISRIHMFLGLQDPHPDSLVKEMDPDLSSKYSKKNINSYCFVTSL